MRLFSRQWGVGKDCVSIYWFAWRGPHPRHAARGPTPARCQRLASLGAAVY